ncbi:MAG: hypothetical protein J6Y94_08560 [Bacteriovoracaceae bacterium]|nr:hypothetical protein [Bacteriovoracaceae bacterium]
MAHPFVQFYSTIFKHVLALFCRGLKVTSGKYGWKWTTIAALVVWAFLLWYGFILSSLDHGLIFFVLPSTYAHFNIIELPTELAGVKLSSFWDSFMILSGLDAGEMIYYNEDWKVFNQILRHPSIWIGLLLVFMALATYNGYMFRQGAGRVKPSKISARLNLLLSLKGVLYLTACCIPFWLILGIVIYRVLNCTPDTITLLTIVIFLLGINRISLNHFVYINSLNLKISSGNKFLKKLIEAFTRSDLITIFLMEYGVKAQCLISLGLIFSYGLVATYILSKCISPIWALGVINFVLLWVAVLVNGAWNYCWGAFYAHYWNYDFSDRDVKYTPIVTRLFNLQRWKHDDVAPPIILEKGNLANIPSPVEQMAKRLRRQKHPEEAEPEETTPQPPTPTPTQDEKSWDEPAKEIDMIPVPAPPPPRTPPKKKEEEPLPQPKFKW